MKFILSLCLVNLICVLNAQANRSYNEAILKNKIFSLYDKQIRPNETVYIGLGVSLLKIISIDEVQGIMRSSIYLYALWMDSRLTWNPANHSNIRALFVPVSALWLPDLYIINSADPSGFITLSDKSLGLIWFNGLIVINTGLLALNTRCNINIYKFPYDSQRCSIVAGSWTQDQSIIKFIDPDLYLTQLGNFTKRYGYKYMATADYEENPIWKLVGTNVSLIMSGSRWLYFTENYDFHFNITLRRQPLYYMINSVFPCFILNLVTLFTFFMPFVLQANLTLTSFLNLAMIAIRVSNFIPIQSDYLPLISLYFFLSLLYSMISFIWFLVFEIIKSKKYQPKWLKLLRFGKNKVHNESINELHEFDKGFLLMNRIAFTLMFLTMFFSLIGIWSSIILDF